MNLELADCNECTGQVQPFIPVIDKMTGKILKMNPQAFGMMNNEEQVEAKAMLPFIFSQLNSGALGDSMMSKAKQIAEELTAFVKEQQKEIKANLLTPSFPPQMYPMPSPTPPAQIPPSNSGEVAKWSGSFNIEPSAKPWYARPEVLIPSIIGVGGIIYLISKK